MHCDLPRWVIYFARFGQLAKGIIFVTVGLLSAQAALHGSGGASDSRSAMRSIAQQPLGRAVLIALVAGLVCYVLWRVLAAFADVERKGSDAKGLILRARSLVIAGIYCGITTAAVKTLAGSASGAGGGDRSARDWTARVMETPFGAWLIVLIGAGITCGGLYQCYRAYSGKFSNKLRLSEMDGAMREWILRICAFGLAARGIVFAIAGGFLVQAGLHSNAQKARGLGGALSSLQAQPYGRWLFGIVAAGLAAYGIYCCIRARYGRWGES